MSELKTNKIATNDGNNVAIDNALKLEQLGELLDQLMKTKLGEDQ